MKQTMLKNRLFILLIGFSLIGVFAHPARAWASVVHGGSSQDNVSLAVPIADRIAAVPTCTALRQADDEITQYEEDLAIFKFLDGYEAKFRQSSNFLMLTIKAEALEKHRQSADGKRFDENCAKKRPRVFDTEKQFCQDFRSQDDALLHDFNKYMTGLRSEIKEAIDSNYEFVALGKNGKPLATNLDDFNEAYKRYKLTVVGKGEAIKRKKQWLKAQLERYPQIYGACG